MSKVLSSGICWRLCNVGAPVPVDQPIRPRLVNGSGVPGALALNWFVFAGSMF